MTISTIPYAMQANAHPAAIFRVATGAPFTTSGILGATELSVAQNGTPNMTVVLGAGRATIQNSYVSNPAGQTWNTGGAYTLYNDAALSLTITASNPTNARIDAVYVSCPDAFYGGASSSGIAGVVAGTPAVSPTPPSVPTNSLLIAYVAVAANATTIVTANLTYEAVLPTVVNTATPAAITAAVAPVGSKLIVPSSVVPTTGTSSVSTLGRITYTGCTAVLANGVFSSTYDQYLVIVSGVAVSTAAVCTAQMSLAGTPDSSSNYDWFGSGWNMAGSAVTMGTGASPQTAWPISNGLSAVAYELAVLLKHPAVATATRGGGVQAEVVITAETAKDTFVGNMDHRVATAYDGVKFLFDHVFTGTIEIYGYNFG